MGFGTVQEMVGWVKRIFNDYDEGELERVCQSQLKRYNQGLRALGDNEFKIEHNGAEMVNKKGLLKGTAELDRDAYQKRCTTGPVMQRADKNGRK